MEDVEEDEEVAVNGDADKKNVAEQAALSEEEACISVHALTGEKNYHTMRIVGMVKKNRVHILIDSGSAHNFLDFEYAKALGRELEQILPRLYL